MDTPVFSLPNHFLDGVLSELLKGLQSSLKLLIRPWAAGILFYVSTDIYIESFGYAPVTAGTVFPIKDEDSAFLLRLCSLLRF